MHMNRRSLIISAAGFIGSSQSIWSLGQSAAVSGPVPWYSLGGKRDALLKQAGSFFGTAKGKYIDMRPHGGAIETADESRNRDLVASQFQMVFAGAPLLPVRFPDGLIMYAARLVDSYATYAMLMMNGDSFDIVAAALIHNRCGIWNDSTDRHIGDNPCEQDRMTLTVFYSGAIAPNQTVTKKFKTWSLRTLAAFRKTGPAAKVIVPDRLRVEIRTL